MSDIALAFGLRRETVSNVVNRKTHKRVREHDLPEPQTPEAAGREVRLRP